MVRSSRLILSPMSVATAIIAVATVTPRVMAAPGEQFAALLPAKRFVHQADEHAYGCANTRLPAARSAS